LGTEAGAWPARDAAFRGLLQRAAASRVSEAILSRELGSLSLADAGRESLNKMAARLLSGAAHMRSYADVGLRVRALREAPFARLMRESMSRNSTLSEADSAAESSAAFLRRLLQWFKYDYFKWVNEPPCVQCGGSTTALGGAHPNPAEAAGGAAVVEIYRCNLPSCTQQTRFPRLNAPGALLESRKGRCGEWANAFTLFALSFGYDARHCVDWTDHVWTEVLLASRGGRWVHVDACEAAFDTPRLYERGWGKKLSFVVSFGERGVADVSARYSSPGSASEQRRAALIPGASMNDFARLIKVLDATQAVNVNAPGSAPSSEEERRTREREALELAAAASWDDGDLKEAETSLGGRISGSLAWRAARDELGAPPQGRDGGASVSIRHGWSRVLRNADSEMPCPTVVASWGSQLAAPTGDGLGIMWRNSYVTSPWRPVRVAMRSTGEPWPRQDGSATAVVGLAASPKSHALWALTHSINDQIATISVFLLRPGARGDVDWKADHVASDGGNASEGSDSSSPPVSRSPLLRAIIAGDSLLVLRNDSLDCAVVTFPHESPCSSLSAIRQKAGGPVGNLSWLPFAAAPGVVSIASTAAGTVLGLVKGVGDKNAAGDRGDMVCVLAHRPPPPPRVDGDESAEFSWKALLSSPVSADPIWVAARDCLEFDTIDASAATSWLALPRIALPSVAAGDAIAPATDVEQPQRLHRFRFPSSFSPSTPGIYEPRLISRAPDWQASQIAGPPIIVVDDRAMAMSASSAWAPFAPADNVAAIAIGKPGTLLAITVSPHVDTHEIHLPASIDSLALKSGGQSG
jgi:hypothetical protein